MGDASACFVCMVAMPEIPAEFRCRVACGVCRSRARLLPSDAPLQAILSSEEPEQLATDGLSTLINPVAIDVYRGWAGFAEGDYTIFEEREKSKDWFDFIVQHIDPGPQMLKLLGEHKLDPSVPVEVLRLIAKHFPERVNVWASAWALTVAAQNVRLSLGPISSNAEARSAAAALAAQPSKFESSHAQSMVERLYLLADLDW